MKLSIFGIFLIFCIAVHGWRYSDYNNIAANFEATENVLMIYDRANTDVVVDGVVQDPFLYNGTALYSHGSVSFFIYVDQSLDVATYEPISMFQSSGLWIEHPEITGNVTISKGGLGGVIPYGRNESEHIQLDFHCVEKGTGLISMMFYYNLNGDNFSTQVYFTKECKHFWTTGAYVAVIILGVVGVAAIVWIITYCAKRNRQRGYQEF